MGSKRSDTIRTPEAEAILGAVADGLFTVDGDFRITRFNQAAEKITGFRAEEAVGQHCWNIFRTEVCESDCVLREALARGGKVECREVSILDRSDRELPIEASASVWTDGEGKFAGGVETFRDVSEVHRLRSELRRTWRLGDLVSRNHEVQDLFARVPAIARDTRPVLLCGPAGTGKESLARTIHRESPRKDGPFLALDPESLPPDLLEVEIVGALHPPGRSAAGSILIRNIEALPTHLQSRIAHLPPGQEGGRARTRLMASTTGDPDSLVWQGRLIEPMRQLLSPLVLQIPALKDRREDIPLLVEEMLERRTARAGGTVPVVSEEAMRTMLAHDWPGNIQELEAVIDQAFASGASGTIGVLDLPDAVRGAGSGGLSLARQGPQVERAAIQAALERHNWNKVRAARDLRISRSTLWRKMKSLGVPLGPPEGDAQGSRA
jgi:PAS domain S-box-containing protein